MKCLLTVCIMPSSTLVQSVQPLPRVGQNPEVPVAHVNDTIPFWHLNGLELGKIPIEQSDLSQCIIGKT